MAKVNFTDKINFSTNAFGAADENKIITANNINEIKQAINTNDNATARIGNKVATLESNVRVLQNANASGGNSTTALRADLNTKIRSISETYRIVKGTSQTSISINYLNESSHTNGNSIPWPTIALTNNDTTREVVESYTLLISAPYKNSSSYRTNFKFHFEASGDYTQFSSDSYDNNVITNLWHNGSDHCILSFYANPEGSGVYVSQQSVKVYDGSIPSTNSLSCVYSWSAKIKTTNLIK